jgi:beta-lactamase regulating signal transducer with metallopeptidase domain
MFFASYFFVFGLFALNVAVASIALGFAAIMVARLVRRDALALRHAFLCVALTLLLASPLAIQIASRYGFGIVPISIDIIDQRERLDLEPSAPKADGIARTAVPVPSLPEDNRSADAITKKQLYTTNSTDTHTTKHRASASDRHPAEFAGAGSTRRRWGVIGLVGGVLAFVWVAVALLLMRRLARGLRRVEQLKRSLRPATDARLVMAARRALAATGRTRTVPVYESGLAPAPLTLGWWASVIVMPRGLASLLDDEELACVLAHEAAHVARHDPAIAVLQQLAGVGFWWNPLLRAVSREINRLRERICDDHVVQQCGDGFPLAKAIIKVAEWSSAREVSLPLAAYFLDAGDEMEVRITRLAQTDRAPAVPLNGISAVLIGLFGIVLAATSWIPALRAQVSATAQTEAATRQAGWQVRIRTVDAEGKAIAHPRIGVELGADDKPLWNPGDRDGWFTATLPTRTPRYCYLLARAHGYAPMRAFWRNGGEKPGDPLPAEFTFVMTKAVTVGGVVVDETGKPIALATVLFSGGDHDSDPARRSEVSFFHEEYTTDERGRWRCDLAPATISSASINVRHPDYAIDTGNFSQDDRIAELRALTHRWILKKGFAVTGRVVDTRGKPIAGAALAIGELNLYSEEGPFRHTDVDGRYRFERVAPHYDLTNDDETIRFTVSIMKPGFKPVMESIPGYGGRPLEDPTKQERVVNFTLDRGVTLELRVVDAQDRPIKGAWVIPDEWRGTTALRVLRQFGIPPETDAQGIWRWTDAPRGEAIGYDVLYSDFSDVRDEKITVDDALVERTIVLKRPQLISGRVTDARTKQPIPAFVVERAFENVAGHPDGLYWASEKAKGKDGRYSIDVTMPPHNGRYTYRVRAAGYEIAVSKSTPFSEGETTVDFALHRKP